MSVEYRYSPAADANNQGSPLVFTAEPFRMLLNDAYLLFHFMLNLLNIIHPIRSANSTDLNELSLTWGNAKAIFIHAILVVSQLLFLISLVLFSGIPFFLYISYFIAFITLNYFVCRLLNGNQSENGLKSRPQPGQASWPNTENERWLFLNGVAVGEHWLQNNVDMIARIFRRPVTGIHNKTAGIIFDIIQCLIERCFQYSTNDVRHCYKLIKQHIYDEEVEKVILILHSQGAIEGSMIMDWLLAEIPSHRLKQLEVYTFGNAANHFNNPLDSDEVKDKNTLCNARIGHIEHFANSKDFVSLWGILHFMRMAEKEGLLRGYENRFRGQLFMRPGGGHQFNQHYLSNVFPLMKKQGAWEVRKLQDDDFMSMKVVNMSNYPMSTTSKPAKRALKSKGPEPVMPDKDGIVGSGPFILDQDGRVGIQLKVYEMSRLWDYRNGGLLTKEKEKKSSAKCKCKCGEAKSGELVPPIPIDDDGRL